MASALTQSELLAKVRKIEIRTKALSHQIFAGEYHSAFKGRGMAFSEVREYRYGDDVRLMDWNVSARMSAPYVKVFEEERELTLMLLVDVSRSGLFGTATRTKRDLIAEVAAVLAFSAILNNDKVGAIFFSDRIEKFIPPKKGRKHILFIIRELLDFQPASNRTDIGMAIEYMTNAIKKRCTVFLLSDFFDHQDYTSQLTIANRRHDVIAVQVYDQRMTELPNVGIVKMHDAETDEDILVDTSSKAVRRAHHEWWIQYQGWLKTVFTKSNVDSVSVRTDEDYVKALLNLFKRRA